MKKYFYPAMILMMFLLACESSHLPDGVLTRKKMVPILVDIHLSEAIFNQRFSIAMLKDSLPEDLYLSVCRKYKMDRTVLEKSLHYYGKHTAEFIPIYDQVLNVLSEMDRLGQRIDQAARQFEVVRTTRSNMLQRPLDRIEGLGGGALPDSPEES